MLLLHLLGGDSGLLVNLALGHLAHGLALLLLLLLLVLALGALAGAAVHAALVVVALPRTDAAHGGAGKADPSPDAGLLTLQQFPAERTIGERFRTDIE